MKWLSVAAATAISGWSAQLYLVHHWTLQFGGFGYARAATGSWAGIAVFIAALAVCIAGTCLWLEKSWGSQAWVIVPFSWTCLSLLLLFV